ncbi:sensor histidine kinase [Streptomyces sp. NPDC021020]|uniref:sensor histidine kinase n=1 Tax=Streptomyces sp. NPDC021020 TaxID=3365109 RepID=UPI0037BD0FAD
MRKTRAWAVRAGVGFWRACAVAAVCLLIPAVWGGAVALGIWWGAANPWSWVAPVLVVAAATPLLARPVCQAVRALVGRWTGTVVPSGYRQAGPVTLLATGYWWNGFSYERTRRDALMDQKLRVRWRDPANWRDLRFTAVAPFTAGLAAVVPPGCAALAVLGLVQPQSGARLAGAAAAVVAVAAAPYAWRLAGPVAVRFLGPSPAMALADRVAELTAQRADVTIAQAAEIRRIERDLHDGAQARLVALGLSLATAQRLLDSDPDRARALMRDAQAGAAASLAELRELVRGIAPPVLSERGLVDAVRALALDLPLDTTVDAEDPVDGAPLRLDPPIEAAVYFGVAELLTNAAKHARATRARITLARTAAGLVVEVHDDGRGGAEARPDGGLAGLRRRLAAFDGTLEVTSPAGGPTRAVMMVPCESW